MAIYSCNGIQVEAETFGNRADPCVLLIMGLGMQLTAWHEGFCRMLAEEGFYVIRFDNRDVGLSTHFEQFGRPNIPLLLLQKFIGFTPKAPYALTDMANDAVALLDQLKISRAHIVGASMGGMIAQTLAIQSPERVLSLTSIMSTTGARALPGPTSEARKALLKPVPKQATTKTTEGIDLLVDGYVATFSVIGSKKFLPKNDQELSVFRARISHNIKRSYRPWGVARQLAAILASPDRTRALNKLAVKALVIHGEDDPLVRPACGAATAKAIPGARLAMIKDMAHDLPEPLWRTIVAIFCEQAHSIPHPAQEPMSKAA
jgi:pimeloyl-ACP methyl ester carboxylesterase